MSTRAEIGTPTLDLWDPTQKFNHKGSITEVRLSRFYHTEWLRRLPTDVGSRSSKTAVRSLSFQPPEPQTIRSPCPLTSSYTPDRWAAAPRIDMALIDEALKRGMGHRDPRGFSSEADPTNSRSTQTHTAIFTSNEQTQWINLRSRRCCRILWLILHWA